jgi:outer membrane immunogenic protein
VKQFNKQSWLVFSVLTALMNASAFASDLGLKTPPAAYNWSGFYIGGNFGYGWGLTDSTLSLSQTSTANPTNISTLQASQSSNVGGLIGGEQVGYNWWFSNRLVGIEADIQASGLSGTTAYQANIINSLPPGSNPATVTDSRRLDWFGTVRGRFGFADDRWLLYATGGVAYGEVNVSGNVQPANPFATIVNAPILWDQTTLRIGWTVGAGAEVPLSRNWTWKVEYLYLSLGMTGNASGGLGNAGGSFGNCYGVPGSGHCVLMDNAASGSITSQFTNNLVRFGFNYKFN